MLLICVEDCNRIKLENHIGVGTYDIKFYMKILKADEISMDQ